MYLTGFADEAAIGIDGQITATKKLGWKHIESRNIDDKNIHNLSNEAFEVVAEKLKEAGIKINCFGSAVANWGKAIDGPFDSSLEEARRAIPRMKHLGTKLIRIMSFAVLKNRPAGDQMEEERFKRVRVLCKMFADEGLIPVHENCMNYGGMGWEYTLRLIEAVPELKLAFDTGNPGLDTPNSPRQSSWEFYLHVKEHIAYIHIKDMVWNHEKNEAVYVFPGEGDREVKRILKDLLVSGYDGGISIEPHMKVVFHDDSVQAQAQARLDNYVEYGHRMERLIKEIRIQQSECSGTCVTRPSAGL